MDETRINRVVALFPVPLQEDIRKRIVAAAALGWSKFNCLPGCDQEQNMLPIDESDLFGANPDGLLHPVPYP